MPLLEKLLLGPIPKASRWKAGPTPAVHTPIPARPGLKGFESLFVTGKKRPYSVGKLVGTIILLAFSLVILPIIGGVPDTQSGSKYA